MDHIVSPSRFRSLFQIIFGISFWLISIPLHSQEVSPKNEAVDFLRAAQFKALKEKNADWGFWGTDSNKFSNWINHSNRLVPVYTFGIDLKAVSGSKSVYRDAERLKELYGKLPEQTLNPKANYLDQTDIHKLQVNAIKAGKKYIFLVIFDGMDWQTTWAAATYQSQKVRYERGKGRGLHFLDYKTGVMDYGAMVTSPHNTGTTFDVNSQVVTNPGGKKRGGYSAQIGGKMPWSRPRSHDYLLGKLRSLPHVVTDSAASATSMTAGIKTFNGAINVDSNGKQVTPIARKLQAEKGFSIGVVTSVPISHATPACAYANNVTRNDYQNLTRDLLGIRSVSHRGQPLSGVDVLIGAGWGERITSEKRIANEVKNKQGLNFEPGNKFLAESDREKIDVRNGGKYVVARRMPGQNGSELLDNAAQKAAEGNHRLLGFFGVPGGHLPYQTADGNYNATRGVSGVEVIKKPEDVEENPTLAQMTQSALKVLEKNEKGFWLMLEPGDVDWANHDNNIDNSIGAVFSGDAAFKVITDWIEKHEAWDESCVILTADHGHYFVPMDPTFLIGQSPNNPASAQAQD